MEILPELLSGRSYHETRGANRADTETEPLPLPWDINNIMKQWEEWDWLSLRGGEWLWEDKEEKFG